jgi:hypothetical protein
VLNADYRPLSTYPLSIIAAQDAVSAIWRERVDVVEAWSDAFFRSPSTTIAVPKIVALRHYAPVSGEPKFCRRSRLPDGAVRPVRRVALADVVYEDRWGQTYRDL